MSLNFFLRPIDGLGFSFGSTGHRVHIGPSIGRFHFGGGQTSFSSSIGPVGISLPIGGIGNGISRMTEGAVMTVLNLIAEAQQDRKNRHEQEVLESQASIHLLSHLHQLIPADPRLYQRTFIEAPSQNETRELLQEELRETRFGGHTISKAEIEDEVNRRFREGLANARHLNRSIDSWQNPVLSLGNSITDHDLVFEAVEMALEAEGIMAHCVGIKGSSITIAVALQGEHIMPKSALTMIEGRVTEEPLSTNFRSHLYAHTAVGLGILTARIAASAAPGLTDINVLGIQRSLQTIGVYEYKPLFILPLTTIGLQDQRWFELNSLEAVQRLVPDATMDIVPGTYRMSRIPSTSQNGLRSAMEYLESEKVFG